MITFSEYKAAETLEEAWQLNQKKNNVVIGGMLWMKMSKKRYNTVIDLSGLGLDKIEETDTQLKIGSMVTLRSLENHEGLEKYTCGAMKESLKHIVGVQFRNSATLGGSIYGRYGFSDVLTMFMAMDSYVELYKGGIVPLAEFAASKYDRDIIVSVIVKKTPGVFAYESVRNSSTDFPVLTCCVSRMDGKVKAAIGARPMRAVIVSDDENIFANMTSENAERFAQYVQSKVSVSGNVRAGKEYREHLVKVLVKRCCLEIMEKEEQK